MVGDGLLLVNKPEGITSFDCIRRLRRTLLSDPATSPIFSEHKRSLKIGHAGTLDPAASGLMLMLFGSVCRQAQQFSKLDKVYSAAITLGATSTTGDREGEIVQSLKPTDQRPSLEKVEDVLDGFIGQVTQVPPAYSAIKIEGQEAYKRARRGEKFEVPSRQVRVYELRVVSYKFPILEVEAKVSSGTYIRTLAEDIGKELGTGAYLSRLVRTKVGSFSLDQAIELSSPAERVLSALRLV